MYFLNNCLLLPVFCSMRLDTRQNSFIHVPAESRKCEIIYLQFYITWFSVFLSISISHGFECNKTYFPSFSYFADLFHEPFGYYNKRNDGHNGHIVRGNRTVTSLSLADKIFAICRFIIYQGKHKKTKMKFYI